MTQELHRVVWSSYLSLQDHARLKGSRVRLMQHAATDGPLSRDMVLENLVNDAHRVPSPLLGIAVWNLLATFGADEDPPADFKNLLRDVLDLEVASARRIRASQPSVFPPYPDQVILDARWAPETSSATLEVCVQKHFEDLKHIVYPQTWSACDYFWTSVGGPGTPIPQRDGTSSGQINAELSLPGTPKGAVQPVTLDVATSVDRLGAYGEFAMHANPQLHKYNGYIKVEKERGRPEATRVTKQVSVQFAGILGQLHRQTLAYWLQAEMVHLVLGQGTGGAT